MQKRRKRLIVLFSILGVFLVLAIVCGTLFSLRTINVVYLSETTNARTSGYTQEQIIKSSNIKKGSNLLFANYNNSLNTLEREFPYAKFSVARNFPNTLNIYVYEREPAFRVRAEEGIWHIYDEELKLLEIVAEANLSMYNNDKLTIMNGLNFKLASSVGQFAKSKEVAKKITILLDAVYSVGGESSPLSIMSDITFRENADNLGFTELLCTMSEDFGGGQILIQGENNLEDKVSYAVFFYLSVITNDYPEHSNSLLTILQNYDSKTNNQAMAFDQDVSV